MGNPAARMGDMHTCPMVSGSVPHEGGPVLMGSADVNIGSMPAARVGDSLACKGPMDLVSRGSSTVFINGRAAARLGDQTAHGGAITQGFALVNIG